MNALGGVIRQARQHVGKPSLRVDVIELGGGDEAVDRSRTPAALIGAGERPVSPSYSHHPNILPILPATVLKRKAVVYVRQSSQSQVQNNLESQRRQYDLVEESRR